MPDSSISNLQALYSLTVLLRANVKNTDRAVENSVHLSLNAHRLFSYSSFAFLWAGMEAFPAVGCVTSVSLHLTPLVFRWHGLI